jgi:hypothetical protein
MTPAWTHTAETLARDAGQGWPAIWTLTQAAAIGALNLAITVPLGVGVSVSYAAMDFREAQDEVEWAHPEVRAGTTASVFGPLRPEDSGQARDALDRLAALALTHAATLAETETNLAAQAALSRVMARLITGRAKLTGRWS